MGTPMNQPPISFVLNAEADTLGRIKHAMKEHGMTMDQAIQFDIAAQIYRHAMITRQAADHLDENLGYAVQSLDSIEAAIEGK